MGELFWTPICCWFYLYRPRSVRSITERCMVASIRFDSFVCLVCLQQHNATGAYYDCCCSLSRYRTNCGAAFEGPAGDGNYEPCSFLYYLILIMLKVKSWWPDEVACDWIITSVYHWWWTARGDALRRTRKSPHALAQNLIIVVVLGGCCRSDLPVSDWQWFDQEQPLRGVRDSWSWFAPFYDGGFSRFWHQWVIAKSGKCCSFYSIWMQWICLCICKSYRNMNGCTWLWFAGFLAGVLWWRFYPWDQL